MGKPNLENVDLYRRILAFDFDGANAPSLRFADRLAQENGWSQAFTARVLHEYRRFLYLAASGTEPVSPSKEVDAAWHLHLTYTRSYWTRLCGEVLGVPLHHTPTEGGEDEQRHYMAQYERTLAVYEHTFGTPAPTDVWPPVAVCFGTPPRVLWKPNDFWVWRKPRALGALKRLAPLLILSLAGCSSMASPFDLPGMKFVYFLVFAFAASMFAALIVRFFWEGPGGEAPAPNALPDTYGLAYLSGGPRAVTLTALATMLEDGRLVATADGTMVTKKAGVDDAEDPVEQALLDAMPYTNDETIRDAVTAKVDQALEVRRVTLERAGLLQTERQHRLRPWITAFPPLLVLLGLGVPRLAMGIANGKPILFLVLALIAGAVATFIIARASTRGTPLTRRGATWIHARRRRTPRFRDAKNTAEAYNFPLAVALFGPAVATGATYGVLSSWLPPLPADVSGQRLPMDGNWWDTSSSYYGWGDSSGGDWSGGGGDSGGGGSSGCGGGGSGCGGCGGGSSN